MALINLLAIICVTVGHLWFAWELWTHDDLLWSVLVLLVPMPLIGLIAWYRSGWDNTYRPPALVYLAGYLVAILTGVA